MSVIVLNVVMLSVFMLNVMLSVIVLNVVLTVIMLNVMLSVVMPCFDGLNVVIPSVEGVCWLLNQRLYF
jgi:hypothetical protein